jgi:hypothetical protein
LWLQVAVAVVGLTLVVALQVVIDLQLQVNLLVAERVQSPCLVFRLAQITQ